MVDVTARCLTLLRQPFILETVLASDKYRPLLSTATRVELIIRLVYITTEDPVINVRRVRQRVQEGGHDVPEDKIRERWSRSMDNLSWFAARADRVVVFDNSGDVPRVIALRHLGGVLELRDPQHPAGQRLRDLAGTAVVR